MSLGKKWTELLVVLLAGTFLALGCAGRDTAKEDAFFENWRLAAETSKGHSPAKRAIGSAPAREGAEGKSVLEKGFPDPPQKALPTRPVTLKMHQASVPVVLRALARGAGQNILINSKVAGEMSVTLQRVPWDQAFLGILRSQGLGYTWEGDVIRVLTRQDMEQELEIEGIKEKIKAQIARKAQAEPLMTRVIPIDFADINKVKPNVEAFLSRDIQGNARGTVMLDEHNNALVVQAVRGDMETIMDIVAELDRPTLQIHIEATIVETSSDTARDLGVQWGWMYGRMNVTGDNSLYVTPGGCCRQHLGTQRTF
ncbi:secretin N-terminal domain-containing protein [Thermodesulfobacteriota bacterium]